MSNQNDNYTVGWICAIEPEYLAAELCLDETHPRMTCRLSPNDTNIYVLGKIGDHNVVIACLPNGSYGTISAANVATNMLRSFPNVRIGLMVGLGGGAPTPDSDIRLGDIVNTGFVNRPPTILLNAVMKLRVDYRRRPGSLEKAIDHILEKEEEELREDLGRPDPSTDILYRSNFVHPENSKKACVEACGMDLSTLVPPRPERKRPRSPMVHYGLIASGNQLMKDAFYRDELAEKWQILCFEMEAAGLMNDFPCLVVRGICDYSDSHKNKEWQAYAAMAAAAYAKDLLYTIPPSGVEDEKKISEVLSG
ncbi:purine and uridine phosphorylase [Trematosphaeria pertusa]|uniref:Purine and uridine phosphorylase n=1 Tax=Trematosphaeria pertusa TaxID=390896 RepID=A0A6A6IDV0_9PLEO|nr:purine and uridine phosphorylase [Trematosphaeria pertusa]KAF2248571.1 purine and uridine phosphorylase [Trematosphaeria pertusa]